MKKSKSNWHSSLAPKKGASTSEKGDNMASAKSKGGGRGGIRKGPK